MKIALAQINPVVGDIGGNAERIIRAIEEARRAGVDLVVLPELCVCGYPPKDLLLHEGFVGACEAASRRVGEGHTGGITAVLGTPLSAGRHSLESCATNERHSTKERHSSKSCATEEGHGLARCATRNSLVVYRNNQLVARYDKRLLPTYDVFDEDRYFSPGDRAVVVEVAGVRVGLAICEDLWRGDDVGFNARYAGVPDPVEELARAGVDVIAVPSGSPFVLGKGLKHRELLASHAKRHGVFVASVNQVGGNDELIFDGHAALHGPDGQILAAAPGFEEHVLVADVEVGAGVGARGGVDPRMEASAEELLFRALTLGLGDYIQKTGFGRAIVAVSGGLDSAVTCALAVAALGSESVTGVSLPGPYSSQGSIDDAKELCERLGVRLHEVSINDALGAYKRALDPTLEAIGEPGLGDALPDVTHENVQARIRGNLLMALSNRTGDILLTTGNKSELAVGYCTLYGDMSGGLAAISDVYKTQVFALARWMNEHHEACGFARAPIPVSTIEKPPSAELAPDQLDEDSLPAYEVLDEILERFVEGRQQPSRIAQETGFDGELVRRVARMVDRNEYKRKQMPTGLKVTHVAFGFGRRMPIAMGWDGA